jgi:hypothetical protein
MANLTVEFDDDELEYLVERARNGGDVRNIVTNYFQSGTEILYDTFLNKVVETVQTELAKPRSYTVVIREIKTYHVNFVYDNNENFDEEILTSISEGEGELLEQETEIVSIDED